MRTWIQNARLIDGTGAPARDGSVLIEGETLVHVGPLSAGDAPSGADTQVVDLAGRTVIPGLVEAHIHLSYWSRPRTRSWRSPTATPPPAPPARCTGWT